MLYHCKALSGLDQNGIFGEPGFRVLRSDHSWLGGQRKRQEGVASYIGSSGNCAGRVFAIEARPPLRVDPPTLLELAAARLRLPPSPQRHWGDSDPPPPEASLDGMGTEGPAPADAACHDQHPWPRATAWCSGTASESARPPAPMPAARWTATHRGGPGADRPSSGEPSCQC
jgi:hypothetical protein